MAVIYLPDERQELSPSLVMNCFSLRDQEIITEELIRDRRVTVMLMWIDGLSIRACGERGRETNEHLPGRSWIELWVP
jgi:hypothetical protein